MIDAFLWAVAFALLIPLTVLIVETFAALMRTVAGLRLLRSGRRASS